MKINKINKMHASKFQWRVFSGKKAPAAAATPAHRAWELEIDKKHIKTRRNVYKSLKTLKNTFKTHQKI